MCMRGGGRLAGALGIARLMEGFHNVKISPDVIIALAHVPDAKRGRVKSALISRLKGTLVTVALMGAVAQDVAEYTLAVPVLSVPVHNQVVLVPHILPLPQIHVVVITTIHHAAKDKIWARVTIYAIMSRCVMTLIAIRGFQIIIATTMPPDAM